jgi:hypothetical protein
MYGHMNVKQLNLFSLFFSSSFKDAAIDALF